ncbi:hypothetical protein [Streptomyces toxytricini]|uniref:STAS domain-containing protein n=1 Tax=Streptomyces toxytricini TaxID=67369 RepID=A0ABW8ETW4_STRT5
MSGRQTVVITHHLAEGALHVQVPQELDVGNRAAAALEIEALVHAHRPGRVVVRLPSRHPSPMTFSALARVHRMCRSLGIPLTTTGPDGEAPPEPLGLALPDRPHQLEHGARHDH